MLSLPAGLRIIELVIEGLNEFHRSMIQMRVCAINKAFLPQEEQN